MFSTVGCRVSPTLSSEEDHESPMQAAVDPLSLSLQTSGRLLYVSASVWVSLARHSPSFVTAEPPLSSLSRRSRRR